jgi:hypothetical protein
MSKTDQEIINGIREITKPLVVIIHGFVKSVDEAKGSCTISDVDGIYKYNVRIKAAIDEKETGMFIIPEENSSVMMARIGNSNKWQIIAYSDIKKVIYRNGKTEFIQDEKFTLKNDVASLKKVLNDLLSELKTATMGPYAFTPNIIAKFEAINTEVNQLLED